MRGSDEPIGEERHVSHQIEVEEEILTVGGRSGKVEAHGAIPLGVPSIGGVDWSLVALRGGRERDSGVEGENLEGDRRFDPLARDGFQVNRLHFSSRIGGE